MDKYLNSKSAFHSYLRKDNNQDEPDTHANMINIYQKLMDEYILKENDPTVC